MKIYGQLESAQLEVLASTPTPTPTGRVFFDTTQALVRVYNGTAWVALTGTNSTFLPSADATYDLGSSSLQWRDLYLSRNAAIGGNLAVTGTSTFTGNVSIGGTPQGDSVPFDVVKSRNGEASLRTRNVNTGASAFGAFRVDADTGTAYFFLNSIAGGAYGGIDAPGSGGIRVVASHATGEVKFYSGNTLAGTFSGTDQSLALTGGATIEKAVTIGSSSNRGLLSLVGTSSLTPTLALNNTNASGGKQWNVSAGSVTAGVFSVVNSTDSVVGFALSATGVPTFVGLGTGLVHSSSLGVFSSSLLVNADVSASAAIAYSKLALTGAILNADLAGSIAYSKLSLTGAILNADLAGSIAYSKLSLTGAILNADLAGSIAASKLVGSDIATVGTITSGTWSGTTIAVNKGGTGITSGTSGGVLYYSASGTLASSGALTASQVVIGGGAGATPTSLAAGSQYQVLVMGAANPGYGQVNLAQSAAITGTLPVGNGGTGVTTSTGTGNTVLSASPTFTGTVLAAAATFSGLFTPTGGIVGVITVSNATAGNLGEYKETVVTSGSPVTLTSATTVEICHIDLTPGDWDVTAIASFDGTITGTILDMGISTSSSSEASTVLGSSRVQTPTFPTAASEQYLVVPNFRVNVSSNTTYYMVSRPTFTVGTLLAYGRLSARRVR